MATAKEEPSQINSRKRATGVIFLTLFVDLAGFSIIFPLFPAMLDWYLPREGTGSVLGQLVSFLSGFAVRQSADSHYLTVVLFGGILGSLYSFLQFIMSPVWGRLSDRYGRRPIMLFSIAGTFLGYLLWIFSGSFLLLVLSRFINGAMAGNISVATAAISDVTSKEKRAKGMALVGVAFALGFILGPALGGFTSGIDLGYSQDPAPFALNPFSAPAVVAAILAAINFFWVLLKFEETLPPEKRGSGNSGSRLQRPKQPEIWRTIQVYFTFLLAFSGMEFTLTFLASERLDYGPTQNAYIFLFVGFILILVQGGLVRRLAPRIGEKNLCMVGLLAGPLGLVALSQANGVGLFYTGLALMGLGIGLASPTLTSLVSLYATSQEQGKHLGSFRSAGSLARAIGPICAALLYWRFGSATAYIAAALFVLISVVLAFKLPQPEK